MTNHSLQNGNTPLHLAATNGNVEVVAALIKAKADFKARNKVLMIREAFVGRAGI